MKKEEKQIWQCENGKIEFKNQKELERYFQGEKPNLKFIRKGYYKADYNFPKINKGRQSS